MSREIPLHGKMAAYERLSLLSSAEEYGMALDPQDTAPFNIAWNSVWKRAEIRIKNTVVATVHHDQMKLTIREGYPQNLDFALTRALDNATALTDRIGKVVRELKKTGQIGMIGKNIPPYSIDTPNPVGALLGAACVDSNLSVVNPYHHRFSILYKSGNNAITTSIEITPTGMNVISPGQGFMGVKEEIFTRLVARGEAEFNRRYSPESVATDVRSLCEGVQKTPMDRYSLEIELRSRSSSNSESFISQTYATVITEGGFVVKGRNGFHNYALSCEILHNGLKVGSIDSHPPTIIISAPFKDIPNIETAMTRLQELWQCEVLGATPQDYPLFSPDDIVKRIEEIDFGYTL